MCAEFRHLELRVPHGALEKLIIGALLSTAIFADFVGACAGASAASDGARSAGKRLRFSSYS